VLSDLDLNLLGTILFLAAGVSRVRDSGQTHAWYRTSMSAGNLHPIEIYVLRQGLWHYQPLEHALVPLRPTSEVAGNGAGALLLLTGIPWRTCWKYRERGWRHLFWDAGTLAANILAVAAAHGVSAELEHGFDDDAVSELAGLVPGEELPVVNIRLSGGGDIPPSGSLSALDFETEPIARHPIRFPLLEEAHAAGDLSGAQVDEWREAAAKFLHPPRSPGAGFPSGVDTSTIEEVVLRRGSTRAFDEKTGRVALLDWSLAAASLDIPSDLRSGGTLLEHYVSVHAIEEHPSGRALWRGPKSLGWLERGDRASDERAASMRLCLGQTLGGSSAYTAFHSCDLTGLFDDEAGARAYRVAQLEAGIAAGRLALCASALGAGATGLTFFDREVSAHFGTLASPMLATAVGIPAAPPVPGGTPGSPFELRKRVARVAPPRR
jgi:SagB-type dehydrogenase family enzyme